jgi:LysR family nitrogen assimilation transcriptional regulator
MAETFVALRLFRSVYETGSFTAAASREHVTQSGVSQQVRKLEQFLGVDLFVRDHGRIAATREGEFYYRWCIDILNMCTEARSAVKKCAHGERHAISVGIVPLLSAGAVGTALRLLLEMKPGLDIRVVEGFTEDLTEQVRARKLDIAFGCAAATKQGMISSVFVRTAEALVSRRDNTRHLSGRLSDLGPLKLALFGPPSRRDFVQGHLAAHGVEIQKVLEFESLAGVLDLVANSDWVAVMPEYNLNHPGLSVTAITDPPLTHDFFIFEPDSTRISPAVQAFRRILNVESLSNAA